MAQFGEMYVPGIYLEGPVDSGEDMVKGFLRAILKDPSKSNIAYGGFAWSIGRVPKEDFEQVVQLSLQHMVEAMDELGGYDETWDGKAE